MRNPLDLLVMLVAAGFLKIALWRMARHMFGGR